MTCPACGYRDNEDADHRCVRCGRRIERRPGEPQPATSAGGAALAPLWREEVAERFDQFRHRRARQQALFDELSIEEKAEEVPHPDPAEKVISFEEIAADRIEPLIVERPPASGPAAHRRVQPLLPPLEPVLASEPEVAASPVTPVRIRALAGLLDLAIITVGCGVFLGVFHLLGGTLQLTERAGAGTALALGGLAAAYFFFYICYGAETPGLQWLGLAVLDYDGNSPRQAQRLVRAAGFLISAAALGLGFLWALADEETLTWHDRMSKTFVTRDPSGGPQP